MTIPTLQWLPERHLGVAATLAHADELIEQVGELLFKYLAREDEVVHLKEVSAGPVSHAVVERIAPIPRKIPLLVADALVTLRAAVEHTLFTEAEFLNGGPLDERFAKTIEMPAQLTYDGFADWVKKRHRHAPDSMKTGSELLRRVSGLQPLHRNVRPDLHPMARLASHTNHAKHRTPAITAVRLVAVIRDDEMPRSIRDLPTRPEEPLRVGQVIAETPLGVRAATTLFPAVGINRPGTDEWPILMHELDEIARWVRTQAVPRLITGSDPPDEEIPTRYEIGIGQLDERRAISEGSTVSAAQRNKMRFGSASARGSMVDLLLPMLDPADRDGLMVWVDHLTDEEVLDRVSRLKPSPSYEPSLMEANMTAIRGLLDEAVQFINGRES